MIVLNHIAIATRNIYEAAYALRARTGLGYYDGGYNEGGQGNKVFPLGGGVYIQLSGIVDAYAPTDPARPGARRTVDLVRTGETFQGLNLRGAVVDLQAIAARRGGTVNANPGGRMQANGERLRVIALSGTPPGMPPVYSFPDLPDHPSAYPPDPAPGLVRPLGVSFVELGGTLQALTDWIGPDAATLPLRFNAGPLGVYAVGVRTSAGEIVIRVPFAREA